MIRLDPSRVDEAIEAGWLAYQERVPGMYGNYLSACVGWTVVAIVSGREVIGALFARAGVIHIGIVPAFRGSWASRRVIKEMLAYGTRTRLLDGEDDSFIRRIGFRQDGGQYQYSRKAA